MPRFNIFALLSVVILCCLASGQSPVAGDIQSQQTTIVKRDPTALATLLRAVTAMGFTTTSSQITVRLTGSVAPVTESEGTPGNFISIVELTDDGYQVRNELEKAADGKRTVFVGSKNGAAFAYGHRVIKMSAHVSMVTAPSQMPVFELIRALIKPRYKVNQVESRQIGRVSAVHVRISDETDLVSKSVTPQDWYFDSATGLPLRWEFRVPDTFNGTPRTVVEGAKEFAKYQITNGVLLPLQITYFRSGRAINVTEIKSVEFNVPLSGSEFDLPKGAN